MYFSFLTAQEAFVLVQKSTVAQSHINLIYKFNLCMIICIKLQSPQDQSLISTSHDIEHTVDTQVSVHKLKGKNLICKKNMLTSNHSNFQHLIITSHYFSFLSNKINLNKGLVDTYSLCLQAHFAQEHQFLMDSVATIKGHKHFMYMFKKVLINSISALCFQISKQLKTIRKVSVSYQPSPNNNFG